MRGTKVTTRDYGMKDCFVKVYSETEKSDTLGQILCDDPSFDRPSWWVGPCIYDLKHTHSLIKTNII